MRCRQGDTLGGSGDRRVKPAVAVLAEDPAFVHHVDRVPLAALLLVAGDRVAEGEWIFRQVGAAGVDSW